VTVHPVAAGFAGICSTGGLSLEPVIVPITDVLDLHTFLPQEVPDLLDEYLCACIAEKIFHVRVIHGKGRGILKKRVHGVLKRHPLVVAFAEAPPEAGGWGATLVTLRDREDK
jgi:DNA-nicking Smr family endonuclease